MPTGGAFALGDTIENPKYILTQPRVGYRIAEEEPDAEPEPAAHVG